MEALYIILQELPMTYSTSSHEISTSPLIKIESDKMIRPTPVNVPSSSKPRSFERTHQFQSVQQQLLFWAVDQYNQHHSKHSASLE